MNDDSGHHGPRLADRVLKALVESAVDGIVVIDGRGLIEGFNPSAERMFGYPAAEVLGRNVAMLMPSPYNAEHDGYLARYQATGEAHIIGIGREVTGRRRDGSTFPMHLSVGEMRLEGERKFTGIIHDLTARVQMEQRLREQAAMARLGEMAAVVAHEVKNPLAGIRGAIQVLGSRMPPESRDAEVTRQIVERIDGLNELVEDLLVFARPPQPRLGRINLGAVARATGELMASDPLMAGVQVTYTGTVGDVMADAGQLKIAIGNLMANSAQAMHGRGTLTVALENGNGQVRLQLHDSGPGIPDAVRDRVFMPFFTTKARGTGLGLPTARQLIEAQHGRIDLACPEAGGTTVTITFPEAPASGTREGIPDASNHPRR
jgi:two-component system, LuxR family, sensor kinase FixL